MKEFTFNVIETQLVLVEYTVEAETEEEARDLASGGFTVNEDSVNILSVIDRDVQELI